MIYPHTIEPLPEHEFPADPDSGERGLGSLHTERGNLPLQDVAVRARISGLTAAVEVEQTFDNPFDRPLEASYVFPLPDRAAVTGLRMEADGRTVTAQLQERAQARATYQQALDQGRRASITEEDRPDVFTLQVGNILPGERVTLRLTLVQPLPYADGEAEFRFPLVVAPRYIPGEPLPGRPTGAGWAADTDAVPDASRITPPVLLPGFPNPVRLAIEVQVDPAGLELTGIRSSLHAVTEQDGRISVRPGERLDRDFILRLGYGRAGACATSLAVVDGTFRLTLLPDLAAVPARPRDVVLLLDRSGSMDGWKMVAARRAAARIVDTLTGTDRFGVISFDSVLERPAGLPDGLVPGSDRNRFRAVEHLAGLEARGGTELLPPLQEALRMLGGAGPEPEPEPAAMARDRVLVLVTDGQVGNEDQILREVTAVLAGIRVHVVGIDRAVNRGFLARLATAGGGRCELVESEERLDDATDRIHRRIAAPLLSGVEASGAEVSGAEASGPEVSGAEASGAEASGAEASGAEVSGDGIEAGTVSPRRHPDLFPGVPLVITGRCGPGLRELVVRARTADGSPWSVTVAASGGESEGIPAAVTALWARMHLRDLEDAYAAYPPDPQLLEREIVATSLRFGVLCRFTALVAVDERVVAEGSPTHRVIQPVEPASGWDLLRRPVAPVRAVLASTPMARPASMARPAPAADGGPVAQASAGRAAARAAFRLRRAPGDAAAGGAPPGTTPLVGGAAVAPAGAGRPLAGGPGPDLRELTHRLTVELARLRAAARDGWQQRLALLSDLGSRLSALLTELQPNPTAGPGGGEGERSELVAQLGRLVRELRACDAELPPTGTAFEALWQDVVRTLTRYVEPGEPAPPGPNPDPAAGPAPGGPSRERFWRHD